MQIVAFYLRYLDEQLLGSPNILGVGKSAIFVMFSVVHIVSPATHNVTLLKHNIIADISQKL